MFIADHEKYICAGIEPAPLACYAIYLFEWIKIIVFKIILCVVM